MTSERSLELIKGTVVSDDNPTFIIAEIGQNHQGDINIAKKMISVAKEAGADCAKFQKRDIAANFAKDVLERPYNSPNSWGATYGEHKEFLEFSEEEYKELMAHAEMVGIHFACSCFDIASVDLMDRLGIHFFKIGSGDTDNLPLIEHIAKTGKPMIISTGMHTMEEIDTTLAVVRKYHNKFALLQCTSSYPANPDNIHLRVIGAWRERYPSTVIGYSGHETGSEITIAAVGAGAKIVERHITLDKSWKGSDHICSLTPPELESLVKSIRIVDRALGGTEKVICSAEYVVKDKLGKCLVSSRDIPSGTVLEENMLTVKVSCAKDGILPCRLAEVIGKTTNSDLQKDCAVCEKHLV